MRLGRGVVGALGGVAALLAFMLGAVSLTRIAGDYLGFPSDLEWTLTGAVDVAGIAGGVMWTGFTGAVRKIGRPMNIVCTTVSGVGVGLDHATHAGRALRDPGVTPALPGSDAAWPWVAFAAGVFLPALATWILHALSVIVDAVDRQPAGVGHRQAVSAAADRQDPLQVVIGPAALARQQPTGRTDSAVGSPRPAAPTAPAAAPTAGPAAGPAAARTNSADSAAGPHALPSAPLRKATTTPTRPRVQPGRSLRSVPSPRPEWMTEDLIGRVVCDMANALNDGETYGAPRLMAEHRLDDGQKITRHKADVLLAYIKDNDLLRESA